MMAFKNSGLVIMLETKDREIRIGDQLENT